MASEPETPNERVRSLAGSTPRARSGLVAVVLLLVAAVGGAYEPTSRYVVKDIEGWQVHVHRDLLPGGEHQSVGAGALRQLKYGLAKTRQMVADGPLEKLQRVKIWLEVDTTHGPHGRTPSYHYHPGLGWLKENDYHPAKHKCVEFGNAASLAKRSDFKTVQVTMHELAHAYHDQVLSFDNPDVLAAHKRASEEGKYPAKDWVVRADHKEFFAGLTTRYFESAQQRKALVERDPVFAEKLAEYWGEPKALFETPLGDAGNGPETNQSTTSDKRSQFTFEDDTKHGRLHVKEGDKKILTYNYRMQLNTGAEAKYERGCYIHPLWDVNDWQRTITEDFPPLDGHLHHRGVGWVWPSVKVRDKKVQTWHPSDPPLRQHFVKWLTREAGADRATIAVENAWLLDDKEKIITETVQIAMHPLRTVSRTLDEKHKNRPVEINAREIDLTLTFDAVGGPVELSGGYGGLLLRGSADMKDGVITTDTGQLDGDSGGRAYKWADLTLKYEQLHKSRGVAIFTPPDHPPHPEGTHSRKGALVPPRWLLRTSWAGLMNVSWPGPRPVKLEPGKPLTLRYRLYIHEGDAGLGQVAEAYARYVGK